uniref:Uncharacterized protein n=1 Tax=Oryza barthii TaxID=65489 RepID=A0A0D3GGL3_9ORYZ
MAVSNNHSTASALPPAPTTATSNSGGNNIVTKVMNPSLLQFKLGACITGRMHIKGPPILQKQHQQSRRSQEIGDRDGSILQQRLQSMSQASDFNLVVNISHASRAAPTQRSSK